MTNRQFYTTAWLAALCLLAGLLAGCNADELSGNPEAATVRTTLSLHTETEGALTKAIDDDGAISTLDVYILDESGTVEKHLTKTDFTDGKATVELKAGKKTICAVANAGDSYGKTAPTNTAVNALVDWLNETATAMPMSTTLDTTWDVSVLQNKHKVELNRMVAKMNVKMVDERVNQTPAVSSVTIGDLMAGTTNLYRSGYGTVVLPTDVKTTEWTWNDISVDATTAEATHEDFYLHENEGTFPVTVKLGDNTERKGSFIATIPRNHIFPLVIHITDYSLDVKVTYELAAIGTLPVSKELRTYSFELPEGCTYKVEVTPKKNMTDQTWSNASWTWGKLENDNASITIDEPIEWPNNAEISENSSFTFTGKVSAQHVSGTCEIPVSLTDNGRTIDFTIQMSTRTLSDNELKDGVTTKSVRPASPRRIDIDL